MPNLTTLTTHSLFCALTNRYVYGLGPLYLEDSLGYPSFYHLDGLGSTRMMTDGDAPLKIEMYEVYDAFGNEGYSNTLQDQPFKFTGEPKDENETELIYLRARYYDPVIGRFITRDTVAGETVSPLSLNRYVYAVNNPVSITDPSGKVIWAPALIGIGGAVNASFQAGFYVGSSQNLTIQGVIDAAGKGFLVGSAGSAAGLVVATTGQYYAAPTSITAITSIAASGTASQLTHNAIQGESLTSGVGSSIASSFIVAPLSEVGLQQVGFNVRTINWTLLPAYVGPNTLRLYGQEAMSNFWEVVLSLFNQNK